MEKARKSRVGPLKSPVKISRIPASGVVNRATEKSINQLIKHSRTSEAQQVGKLSIFPSSCAPLLLFAARLETGSNALSGKLLPFSLPVSPLELFPPKTFKFREFSRTHTCRRSVSTNSKRRLLSYSPADNLHDPMMRA